MTDSLNPNDPILIHGFSLNGYRSFDRQNLIGPFSKINLFIGPNNVGKSNVLRFVKEKYCHMLSSSNPCNRTPFEVPDFFNRDESRSIHLLAGLPENSGPVDSFRSRFYASHSTSRDLPQTLARHGLFWVPRCLSHSKTNCDYVAKVAEQAHTEMSEHPLFVPSTAAEIASYLANTPLIEIPPPSLGEERPTVIYVPELRRIVGGEIREDWFSSGWDGSGAIQLLANLFAPGDEKRSFADYYAKKEKHKRIERFLAGLLGRSSEAIKLEPNSTMETIVVGIDDHFESLNALGGGIRQAILFAIVSTFYNNCVFCIEEPETNMHPDLQRRLVEYLANQTSNQYFISSHSSVFIDSGFCKVFRVERHGKRSTITAPKSNSEKFSVCQDLGCRASDIMQANAVIWVEGPSDAIYIRRWMKDSALRETSDYTIMFYGGSLRKYLDMSGESQDDPEDEHRINQMCDLMLLNRNAFILADSDRDTANGKFGRGFHAKEVLHAKFHDAFLPHWYTKGRSIENYVNPIYLDEAKKAMHPESTFPKCDSWYSFATKKYVIPRKNEKDSKKKEKERLEEIDKIGLAQRLCSNPADDLFRDDADFTALKFELIEFIRDPSAFIAKTKRSRNEKRITDGASKGT